MEFTVNERNYGRLYCSEPCRRGRGLQAQREREGKNCKQCGKNFPWSRYAFCSIECAGEADRLTRMRAGARYSAMRKARIRAHTLDFDPRLNIRALMELMWRYGIAVRCYGCGARMSERLLFLPRNDPRYPTHEHIVPLARGGSHTLENSAISHRQCNMRKSASEPVQGDMLAQL